MSTITMSTKTHRIPQWKIEEVEELAELIRKHKVIALADLTKIPTKQLQIIRKNLRDKVVFRVTKNTLFKLAAEKANLKNFDEIRKYLEGSNLFLFTNINPFELVLLLEKYKAKAPAKPGDIAPTEIVIPAGSTGIPPGPMLSVFGRLKIPTRVQQGSIWISKDTVVAKPGDKISPELASILQKLGIEPIEVKIQLKVAYDDGLIIPKEKLIIDIEEYKNNIIEAHQNALKIGVEIAYPEPTILELTLTKAHLNALMLAVEASIITPETIELIIARAEAQARALASMLAQKVPELGLEVEVPAQPAAEEEKKEEKEEEEKKETSEEEIAEGLAALFG